MNICRLDNLPIELIHNLLSYFSAHEIFYTFINVSNYLNAILVNYSNYQINFKSITRTNFDLICQYIIPDQVISLTISNDKNTPGLIELFLSHFQINQFIHLKSLILIEIGADFWENIIPKLIELKKLRSFCYIASNQNNSWICNLDSDRVTELDKNLSKSYAPILPQLYKLRLCHGDFLESIKFPCLQYLILERSSNNLIKHISSVAPQLKFLNTSFTNIELTTELIYPFPQLNRLILTIHGLNISIKHIEQMLLNLPQLKHLELIANCNNDVVNGERLRMNVKNLITFKFSFDLLHELKSQDLDSFRTSFWLEEKHWFVGYKFKHLFSVPHFLTTETNENFQILPYSTVPNNEIFYEHINELELIEASRNINHYFNKVQTLTLCCTIPLSTLEKIVNFNRIQRLILNERMESYPIKVLINKMSNLHQISIRHSLKSFLKQFRYKKLKQIQTLELCNPFVYTDDFDMQQLCRVFENIEHLHVDQICSTIQIFNFLDRFKHLSTASFRYLSWYDVDDNTNPCHSNIESTLDRVRRIQKLNYTFRFDSSSVYFWI